MFTLKEVYTIITNSNFELFKKLTRNAIIITNSDKSESKSLTIRDEEILRDHFNYEIISIRYEKDKYLMIAIREVQNNESFNTCT